MTAALGKVGMRDLSDVIAQRTGLHFPPDRWPDMIRGVNAASGELGVVDADACARLLKTRALTPTEIEILASHLTVGETYFYRDRSTFEVLERQILPPLIESRRDGARNLRLWSAGCCTGEEAYSLGISCARAVPDAGSWNISILATDINRKFLAKAEAGVYSEWSFRGTPAWLREQYFAPAPQKKLAINPRIKGMVQFGYLNLAEDVYPSLHNLTNAMDVIFCRNVLMYLDPDHQGRVVNGLHRCLVDGGYLAVNPAEARPDLFPMFIMESVGGVVLFRKAAMRARQRARTLPVWPPPPAEISVRTPPSVAAVVRVPPPPVVAPAPVVPAAPVARPDDLALAQALANQGRLAEALDSCGQAIVAERTNPAAHFLYATVCQELGRPEDAIAALGKVLYLDQDFVLAHHALGGIYRRLGRQKESARHFAVALRLLSARGRDDVVPESDGMTCGRLAESVRTMMGA